MPAMATPKKKTTADTSKPKPSKDRGPVLYLRLSDDDEAALTGYIAAQEVPPDRTAVGLTALRQFLGRHGFGALAPKGKP